MRAMHDASRRDVARLQRIVADIDADEAVEVQARQVWAELRGHLDRHHRAEDDDLWPVLRAHLTAAGELREVDRMIEEHRAIAAAIDDVDRAFAAERDMAGAMRALERTLDDHLDHEERVVVPLLERHLSRAEWRRFLMTERRRTPLRERPDFLGWVLDDATEEYADAVLAELPPPGRLVYRYVIRPRYETRHRAARELADV